MKKIVLLVVLSTLGFGTAFSQVLSGQITDQRGNPLVGAYVIHIGSEHHAHTNEAGNFILPEMKSGDSLQISYIGYASKVQKVDNLRDYLRIRLSEVKMELGEITIGSGIDPLQVISRIDTETNPVKSSQEILRKVPGLFIGQHAGGGKAEQIFLRGFDIDHGTDVNLTVDGMPVNMVSHAHGQGYSDLHFLIPETIEKIDYGKGPYNAEKGNFATAGYVNFDTKRSLESSTIKLEGGRFGTKRALGMFNLVDEDRTNAYIATEYLYTDGPFESSQYFNRLNLLGKLSTRFLSGDMMTLTVSNFRSTWDASGQIPQRAVDSGQITRFGALDDTEGGNTGRTNFAVNYSKILDENTFVESNTYYSLYDFELFSNFTFFLEDTVNGDQIRQQEQRRIFGNETTINHSTNVLGKSLEIIVGAGFRNDVVDDMGLSNTINRDSLQSRIQYGDVNESNYYGFLDLEFEFGDLIINPGLRYDFFEFNYEDQLIPEYNPESLQKGTFSPKLNFIYNTSRNFQVFLKSGIGFHSNDTRLVLERNNNRSIIPLAYGLDLGAIWKPAPRLLINTALWYLLSEQEFVYVGDAGIVEPSGRSRRRGIDFGLRYQITEDLYANFDINYAHARSIDDPSGEDFIPLAPNLTSIGGISYQSDRFSVGVNGRYLRDRAANSDESVIAVGYTIFDANASYKFKRFTLGMLIENIFNTDWIETQFDTESRIRLADGTLEADPVSEIHFTPGTPFNFRTSLSYEF